MPHLSRYALAVALTLLGADLARAQFGSPYGSSYPSGSRLPGSQFGRPGRLTAFDYARPSGMYGTSQFGSSDPFTTLGGGGMTGNPTVDAILQQHGMGGRLPTGHPMDGWGRPQNSPFNPARFNAIQYPPQRPQQRVEVRTQPVFVPASTVAPPTQIRPVSQIQSAPQIPHAAEVQQDPDWLNVPFLVAAAIAVVSTSACIYLATMRK